MTPRGVGALITRLFTCGYFAFFGGLVVSAIASMELPKAARTVGLGSGEAVLQLGLIVAGTVATAAGCFLMARAPLLRQADFSAIIIFFIITPLPAILGVGINWLGGRFRKSDASAWQVGLVGLGIFLLALAGSWVAQGIPLAGTHNDYREFLWAVVGNLGIGVLCLAAMPLFAGPTAEPDGNKPKEVPPANPGPSS